MTNPQDVSGFTLLSQGEYKGIPGKTVNETGIHTISRRT